MELESSCVPLGFRFHPTEEELVGYYLKRKIQSLQIDLDVIVDLDLYRMEPWDIQGTDSRTTPNQFYNIHTLLSDLFRSRYIHV